MSQKPYPVDPICIQVAEHFLSDLRVTDSEVRELAEEIQKLCENFCGTSGTVKSTG